jgi:hypothetical protein
VTESTTPDVVLTSDQIAGLLPHRYPFALVDRVIAHEPGVSAIAIKNVTVNEPQALKCKPRALDEKELELITDLKSMDEVLPRPTADALNGTIFTGEFNPADLAT